MAVKGNFFTIDAMIGSAILLSIILITTTFYIEEKSNTDVNYLSNDLINVLSTLKVGETGNAYIAELKFKGNITDNDLNNSILEQIGRFWALGSDVLAENLSHEVISGLMPSGYGYGVWMNENQTYNLTNSEVAMLFSYKRIISGIERDKPIEGFTSTIVLNSIENRLTSSFAYFGGFVGEGNITKFLTLPGNLTNMSNIQEAILELDAGTDFKLFINDQFAGDFPQGSGGGSYMVPDRWFINASYFDLFHNGTNNFSIKFLNISENFTASGPKYIGGGFLKVRYYSNETGESEIDFVDSDTATKRIYLPGIEGFINLFSSVYVPGDIQSMALYLHYNTTYETFLSIGNVTVHRNETNGTVGARVGNATLFQNFTDSGINLSDLGLRTLPIRMGFVEVSRDISPADIILITDVSGSMSADYMEGLSGGRLAGNAPYLSFSSVAGALSSVTFNFNLTDVSFNYESLDVRGYGTSGNVNVYVTPPGSGETRAQCDENPDPCGGVDGDTDEFYQNSNPPEGEWTIRIYSTPGQTVYADVYLSKIDAARNAGDNFVDSVLANNGAMVGLVSYESSTDSTMALTDNATELKDEIDAYSAGGGTCICCGILDAISLLNTDNTTALITRRSTGWKYDETNLSAGPAGWDDTGFDDSSWSTGQAVFRNSYGGLGNPSTILNLYGGNYYFRKNFTIADASAISDAKLYVLSDNGADIFLNGNLIDNNYGDQPGMEGNAQYWDRDGIDVNEALLQDGENVIAARLKNQMTCANQLVWDGWPWPLWHWEWVCWASNTAFDLEFAVSYVADVTEVRQKSMIVMSDGNANDDCNMDPVPDHDGDFDTSDDPQDHAIEAACQAFVDYGIRVYAVGLGDSVDQATLQAIAACGDASYYNSSSVDELDEVYELIGMEEIAYSTTQVANTSGIQKSFLYPDSYIEFNYTPIIERPWGRIMLSIEGEQFGNNQSSGLLYLPSSVTLTDLKSTSYSADKWTSYLSLQNSVDYPVFNLSDYGDGFQVLGDAFIVDIPTNIFELTAQNNITVTTGIGPANFTGGSVSNRLIYSVYVDKTIDPGGVFSTIEGCNWSFQLEDYTTRDISIPSTYNGSMRCYYNITNHDYATSVNSTDDGIQYGIFQVFSLFDFDNDGLISIDLTENNLEIRSESLEGVPSMWGPAIAEVRVWK